MQVKIKLEWKVANMIEAVGEEDGECVYTETKAFQCYVFEINGLPPNIEVKIGNFIKIFSKKTGKMVFQSKDAERDQLVAMEIAEKKLAELSGIK